VYEWVVIGVTPTFQIYVSEITPTIGLTRKFTVALTGPGIVRLTFIGVFSTSSGIFWVCRKAVARGDADEYDTIHVDATDET
jgi:hypothetical protein